VEQGKRTPSELLESTGQIDMDRLKKLEEAHINGREDQSALIYGLVVFGVMMHGDPSNIL